MKLATALAVPLVALALVTSLEVVKTSSAVGAIRRQTELARSAIGPAGLITTVQNERTWTLVEVMGIENMVQVQDEGYDETRAATDRAIAAFRDEIDRRGGQVARAYRPALDRLDELQRIRADTDAFTAPRSLANIDFDRTIFRRYTDLVEPLFDATTRVTYEVNDADLRQGTKLADAVARQIETISQLMILTLGDAMMSPGGVDQPSEITEIAALHSEYQRQDQVMLSGTGVYARIARELFPRDVSGHVGQLVDEALSTGRVADPTAAISAFNVPRDEGYLGYQNAVHEAINRRADHLNRSAEDRRLWLSVLAGGAFAAAVVLTLVVSRSITRPLQDLTVQAADMADKRLPDAVLDVLETPLGEDVHVPHIEPVTVRTRDEVSDVAAALNTVQESALDLAVEQAVLRRNIADSFVNLGRRSQNLLGRQLDFITELETNETDSETLASLFRLDHLATRMRRNAESLLVLAGIEPPRKWVAPVRLTDVIRAALGEVESYQRVSLRGVDAATVVGTVAADLAHLLAELVENALTFSPPDRAVEIMGHHRSDGGYSLAVVDAGFGMPPEDLARANRRLAGYESFAVAPSKYLGHYVAGNLAGRHGIAIQLRESPGNGVMAAVDLPPDLITTDAPRGTVTTDPDGMLAVAPLPFAPDGPAPLVPTAAPVGPSGHPPSPPVPVADRTANGLVKRPRPAQTTANGLVRRVKGAQLPAAQPVSLRRGDGAAEAAGPPADAAARDVYGFLSSFSSGVRRGLDEARGS